MMVESKYSLGDFVYITTDEDQKKRIITEIKVKVAGIMYEVSFGTTVSYHYDFELSPEPDTTLLLKAMR